jgi:hypothetical protein
MLKPTLKYYKRKLLKHLLATLMLWSLAPAVIAQQSPKAVIGNIITTINNRNTDRAVEKVYLQTDKPIYHTGDTLWFKAYLLEQTYLYPSKKSGVLYVELANDSNRMVKRIMLPINGITYGNIALDDKLLPQGGYILRAYTNWMRNFDDALIFKKQFYISAANNNAWLINYNTRTAKEADKYKVQLALNVNSFDTGPVGLREMQLRLTDGKRTWFKNNINTNIQGFANVNFDLPEKAGFKDLSLSIRDLRKGEGNRNLIMPMALNRPENIDLQFMPEGGSMVAGLPAKIAFKAINEDGYGADVAGEVFNSKQQQVATFRAIHKGIGTFKLLPVAGEVYTAKLKLPDGSYKNYPLPAVKPSGFTLSVTNPFKSDSIEVTISATPDIPSNNSSYYLIGHARGMAFYGALVRLNNGIAKIHIDKKAFPGGVVSFTLIGADKKALNQRLIFADRNDKLNISISSSKPIYKQRDSVALNIKVTDMGGVPVQGSFSLAVTDDGQVKADSLKSNSIATYLLLTSNLKGSIQDPGYYEHAADDATKWQQLDQLLLAQGWAVYDWDAAMAPQKPLPFATEPEFLVTGRVTNAFNKPVANSGVLLFSRKPMLMVDTVTNAAGTFTFKGVFPADTAVYFLQARNKKGKSSNVGIEIDEFKPLVFPPLNERITPWYVNADNNNLAIIKKQITLQQNLETFTRGKMLKEVVIKNKRIVKDSKNLNGPGEADVIIDEEELQKAGRTTLGDLLYKRVKGFGYRADKGGNLFWNIYGANAHLIIDGTDTEFFRPDGISVYQYLKQYFDYYDAEEIKGIEVMTNPSRSSSYTIRYVSPMALPWDHTFIEVTTRSGHGPFVKKAVGTYVYRPMPFSVPKQFYAPKYTINAAPDMTDIRSTIHWEPNFVTDKDGKATVSFYTADAPGKYTIIAEGIDLQGSVGIKRASISVEKR